MNRIADAMEPYLYANAIRFVRNIPQMTAASSIAQANSMGGFDFYLALHSNAAGEGKEGTVRGIIAFYYPGSREGERAAELFAEGFRRIYPLPNEVRAMETTALGEVRRPKYPANLLEIGYHDNYDDARWVEENTDQIAQSIVRSLCEYFGIPFIYPQPPRTGKIATGGTPLRLRNYPSTQGAVIALMPNGAEVTVYGAWNGWYVVSYNAQAGYASGDYISL